MSLMQICGKIGAGVSVLVVLLFVALCLLVVACLIAGAYESMTNPNAANQTAQEYAALQQNISAGAGQLAQAAPQGMMDPAEYIWTPMTSQSWEQISDILHTNSTDDTKFVSNVNFYTQSHIRYSYNITDWSVETPNRTWQTGQGSCIDIALLDTAMLTRHGIDAHIVYGLANGNKPHTTVQIKIGSSSFMIDHRTVTQYQKLGDGLAPGQYMLPDIAVPGGSGGS
jgi:hypothetical protein